MESKKVVHVSLKTQLYNNKSDWYFGSVAAIYDVLTPEILGIKQSTLMQYLWHRNGEYENDKCKVSTSELIRKSSQKKKSNETI